jgi:hypothetical protein
MARASAQRGTGARSNLGKTNALAYKGKGIFI